MQKWAFFICVYWSNFDFSVIWVLLGPYAHFFTWKVHLFLYWCYSISIRIISEKTKWPSLWKKWAFDRKNTIHRSITHFLPQKPLQKYMGSREGLILISFDTDGVTSKEIDGPFRWKNGHIALTIKNAHFCIQELQIFYDSDMIVIKLEKKLNFCSI